MHTTLRDGRLAIEQKSASGLRRPLFALGAVGLVATFTAWHSFAVKAADPVGAPPGESVDLRASSVPRLVPAAELSLPARSRPQPSVGPAPVEDLRDEVQAGAAAAMASVTTPAQLDAFLRKAKDAALAKGRVTALEVEPAFAAIRSVFANDPTRVQEEIADFSNEMAALSRELGLESPSPSTELSPINPQPEQELR